MRVLILILVGALLGCERTPEPAAAPPPTTVEATESPRIAAMSPAIAHMLVELGLERRIVAKHDWDLVLADSVPAAGDQESLDYEVLLGSTPTHVLLEWGGRSPPERLARLADDQGWVVRNVGSILTLDDIARTADDLYLDFVSPIRPGPEPTLSVGPDGVSFSNMDPGPGLSPTLPSASLAHAWRDRGDAMDLAGRVLLLASVDPPAAVGPGSFHHEILQRLGGTPAITGGGPWQELDLEDIIALAPDSIVLILPRAPDAPVQNGKATGMLGGLSALDVPAIASGRVGLIDDPLSHLPSLCMGGFADRLAGLLEVWASRAPVGAASP